MTAILLTPDRAQQVDWLAQMATQGTPLRRYQAIEEAAQHLSAVEQFALWQRVQSSWPFMDSHERSLWSRLLQRISSGSVGNSFTDAFDIDTYVDEAKKIEANKGKNTGPQAEVSTFFDVSGEQFGRVKYSFREKELPRHSFRVTVQATIPVGYADAWDKAVEQVSGTIPSFLLKSGDKDLNAHDIALLIKRNTALETLLRKQYEANGGKGRVTLWYNVNLKPLDWFKSALSSYGREFWDQGVVTAQYLDKKRKQVVDAASNTGSWLNRWKWWLVGGALGGTALVYGTVIAGSAYILRPRVNVVNQK